MSIFGSLDLISISSIILEKFCKFKIPGLYLVISICFSSSLIMEVFIFFLVI